MQIAFRSLAYFFSVVGHPLLMVIYIFMLYSWINPYLFPYSEDRSFDLLYLVIFFTAVFIPLISVALMRGVGFISSFRMQERSERVGPLIATSICYLWLYLNIRTHSAIPIAFSDFVLGAIIALFISFFINAFVKISLHAVGIGGAFVALVLYLLKFGQSYTALTFGESEVLLLHGVTIIVLAMVFSGSVLTSRLYLKAHTNQDVMGGLMVGALGQLIAVVVF